MAKRCSDDDELPSKRARAENSRTVPKSSKLSPKLSSSSKKASLETPLNTIPKRVQELSWFSQVNLDGKPPTYCSRMLGECKRMFLTQEATETNACFEFEQPPKRLDLSQFNFLYKASGMPHDCPLRKDLERCKVSGVTCELNIPETFPMAAPFIRVVYPKLKGGYIFASGAVCFEALTPQGWVTTMSLPSLAMALVAFFNCKERPVSVEHVGEGGVIKEYNFDAAKKEIAHIIRAHKDGSSWSQKREDMKS